MTPLTSHHDFDLNHLRRGTTYRARTNAGVVAGEYLGIEAPHGDHAILLRHADRTESIPLGAITAIARAA